MEGGKMGECDFFLGRFILYVIFCLVFVLLVRLWVLGSSVVCGDGKGYDSCWKVWGGD